MKDFFNIGFSCMLNFVFAVYLFYIAFTLKLKNGSFSLDTKLSPSRIFLCFAFIALFNGIFILLSIFNLRKLSFVFGNMMIFSCGLASTYLLTDFVLSLKVKNKTVIYLFNITSISFACFVSFMNIQEVSFTITNGYKIQAYPVFPSVKGFTWLELYYFVYLLIFPVLTFIFVLRKVLKEKDYPYRTFLAYFDAALVGSFIYLVVILLNSFFATKVDLYNILFPFAFVLFAIILWFSFQNESLQHSFVKFVIRSFLLVVFFQGFAFALLYETAKIIPDGKVRYLYFTMLGSVLTIFLIGGWYKSKSLYSEYAEKEEFKKLGYRISEENKFLQYLQYYTENITDNNADIEYNIGENTKTSDDVLDFIRISTSRYLIVFGKIDKNTPAIRRNMLILKSVFRTIFQNCDDIKQFVQKVNEYIYKNIPKTASIKSFFGIFDLEEGNLHYVNCNMNFVSHYNSKLNNAETFHIPPCFLGVEENLLKNLVVQSIHFEKGDRFYVGSDNDIDIKAKTIKAENSFLEIRYRGQK